MQRNREYGPGDDAEIAASGENLEEAVVEIKNLLPQLEDAIGRVCRKLANVQSDRLYKRPIGDLILCPTRLLGAV